jgi:hypothetical protein
MGHARPDLREVTPMSLSECSRFSAGLQSNAALRAEAAKAWADTSHGTPLAAMVALAVSKGYGVTLAEAREHVKGQAAASGRTLSDADLDGVAGGNYYAAMGAAALSGKPPPPTGFDLWGRTF